MCRVGYFVLLVAVGGVRVVPSDKDAIRVHVPASALNQVLDDLWRHHLLAVENAPDHAHDNMPHNPQFPRVYWDNWHRLQSHLMFNKKTNFEGVLRQVVLIDNKKLAQMLTPDAASTPMLGTAANYFLKLMAFEATVTLHGAPKATIRDGSLTLSLKAELAVYGKFWEWALKVVSQACDVIKTCGKDIAKHGRMQLTSIKADLELDAGLETVNPSTIAEQLLHAMHIDPSVDEPHVLNLRIGAARVTGAEVSGRGILSADFRKKVPLPEFATQAFDFMKSTLLNKLNELIQDQVPLVGRVLSEHPINITPLVGNLRKTLGVSLQTIEVAFERDELVLFVRLPLLTDSSPKLDNAAGEDEDDVFFDAEEWPWVSDALPEWKQHEIEEANRYFDSLRYNPQTGFVEEHDPGDVLEYW